MQQVFLFMTNDSIKMQQIVGPEMYNTLIHNNLTMTMLTTLTVDFGGLSLTFKEKSVEKSTWVLTFTIAILLNLKRGTLRFS